MLTRRSLLTSSAALGAAAWFTPPVRSAFAQAGLDPARPEDLFLIHRKLNYTYDDRLVYWLIDATRYGHTDYQFTPFWRMNVGMIFKIIPTGAFSFDMRAASIIYYTDLETGELLETFDNPFTGERVAVRQPGLNRIRRVHGLDGIIPEPSSFNGYERTSYDGSIGPAWVVGDDVWCRADTVYRYEPTAENAEGGPIQVNDWSTLHGSISEVADPDVASANATHVFNDINTFPGWLNMRGVEGNYVSRGFGRKGWSTDVFTDRLNALIADKHPEVLDDPEAVIMGG